MKFYNGEQQGYEGGSSKKEGESVQVRLEGRTCSQGEFVEKEFRLRPRGRQGREFGRERESLVEGSQPSSCGCTCAAQNAEPFQLSGS